MTQRARTADSRASMFAHALFVAFIFSFFHLPQSERPSDPHELLGPQCRVVRGNLARVEREKALLIASRKRQCLLYTAQKRSEHSKQCASTWGFGPKQTNIETIQRRLACSLHKDDINDQKSCDLGHTNVFAPGFSSFLLPPFHARKVAFSCLFTNGNRSGNGDRIARCAFATRKLKITLGPLAGRRSKTLRGHRALSLPL